MRTILAFLLLMASSAAGAQSPDRAPDQAYIAARERAIAELARMADAQKKNEEDSPIPTDPQQAFRSDAFLSLATASNWRVTPFASLPIVKPAGATLAVAMLVTENQGFLLGPRGQIAVSVITGGRVFIAVAKATATDAPLTACGAIYDGYGTRSEAAAGADAARLQEQGQATFEKCWAERAKGDHAFKALTKEAQDLADRLAAG